MAFGWTHLLDMFFSNLSRMVHKKNTDGGSLLPLKTAIREAAFRYCQWLKNILTCLTPDSPCWSAYVTKTRVQLRFLLFLHYSLKFPSLKFNVDQSHQKTCLFMLYDLTCLPNSYITCHIASFYSCQWTSERKSKIIIDKLIVFRQLTQIFIFAGLCLMDN